ncbi:ABC transporter substrate-binding protein [Mucilaginibacter sp. SMC90]|uniref:heme/hemin ABC transporter substrate-binding protein n=1 Tax=Mucilaginibacter sp. SMC90 TaxID=2929803 RepID=UPI001FB40E13|nr:ABC transporter substrate-binding protein [Mucilaginibacter sp. SMC90]UOE52320.1 ABC transporter substrate-binding protein [Mucilaginibacter sp. SMC90]
MKLSIKFIKDLLLLFLLGFSISASAAAPKRIITLSGALTETVDALGFGKNIVATDVTSIYPAYVNNLPKVSKNRTVSAEGLISFKPDLVLAPEGSVSKEIAYQLQSAGINLINIKQEFSVAGSIAFIKAVAAALQVQGKGEALAKQTQSKVNKALAEVKKNSKTPKVLFIYARGTGVMLVAGQNTNIDAIISLAGGKNAAQGFDNFKPYTTESLIEANPDVILMFDFGLSSLGGADAVLKMPGVAQTNAGKNKRIVQMDGELLINFSVRLDQAIATLNKNLQ